MCRARAAHGGGKAAAREWLVVLSFSLRPGVSGMFEWTSAKRAPRYDTLGDSFLRTNGKVEPGVERGEAFSRRETEIEIKASDRVNSSGAHDP
ncbi:unnamed protein product [Lasius platythorax]|uniref:Uncharacterized protein n=1 Tax=Lasius platythorax TaxID=488582 RepID=A0AAV2NVB6_9HYME